MNDNKHKQGMNYKLHLKCGQVQLEAVGDKQFVENKFKELETTIKSLIDKEVHKVPLIKKEEYYDGSKQMAEDAKDTTLSRFIAEKGPIKTTDVVLSVLYHLDKVKNVKWISVKDIKTACNEAFDKPVKNISGALQNNIKKGFIAKEQKDLKSSYYKINAAGVKYVEKGF